MKGIRSVWMLAALCCGVASGCVYIEDVDGGQGEQPDEVLSTPFETTLLAMHTEYDIHRQVDGQLFAVYDVYLALHEEQHESYCLLAESQNVAPLYGGAQVLLRLEALVPDSENARRYGRDVKGVCPVGEYLLSGDGEIYNSSVGWWSSGHSPQLREGQGRYRRWDGSGELVSEQEGRTGYVKITRAEEGDCHVSVDMNLGKRIHAVYETDLSIDASSDNACDF